MHTAVCYAICISHLCSALDELLLWLDVDDPILTLSLSQVRETFRLLVVLCEVGGSLATARSAVLRLTFGLSPTAWAGAPEPCAGPWPGCPDRLEISSAAASLRAPAAFPCRAARACPAAFDEARFSEVFNGGRSPVRSNTAMKNPSVSSASGSTRTSFIAPSTEPGRPRRCHVGKGSCASPQNPCFSIIHCSKGPSAPQSCNAHSRKFSSDAHSNTPLTASGHKQKYSVPVQQGLLLIPPILR